MKIVIALLVFSVIIIVHELGHFLLAKLNKVTVIEFSLGMGPRLCTFEAGGTRYSLKVFPFGGSCMMLGEDGTDEGEGSFSSKSVWARISVIAAGPVFNFILAFLLSLIIIGSIGYDAPVILNVTEGMPAELAGLQKGDRILRVNGKTIHFYRDFQNYVTFNSGKPLQFVYEREGQTKEVLIVPKQTNRGYKFGISGNVNYRERTDTLETIKYSLYEVKYWIETTIESLRMIVSGGITLNDMSGPVGVVSVIGEAYEESRTEGAFYVWLNMINIAILLTANLGVMNLLPIPALDGGRLLFLLIEVISRRRIDPETESKIHMAGLMFLMVLMVIVMANDIIKIFV